MDITINDDEAALVFKADGNYDLVFPKNQNVNDDELVSQGVAIAFMLTVKLGEQEFVKSLFDDLESLMAMIDLLEHPEVKEQVKQNKSLQVYIRDLKQSWSEQSTSKE